MSPRTAPKSQAPESADMAELSRQLLKAQEEERRRISRELHDETGQTLMVLRFQLEMLGADLHSPAERTKIQESLELLDRTIEGLRRTIARLSPRVLEELGLVAAIRQQSQLLARHTGIKAQLDLPDDMGDVDHDVQVALYRSVQESLHNVAKHSRAKNFTIKLARHTGRLSLQIEDDGSGFSVRGSHEKGFGLTGMRERVAALGGSVTIRSAKEKGTRVRIVFPAEERGTNRHPTASSLQRVPAA